MKYDPEKFIESEREEQPTRRQHYSDETDLAIQQAKLDALRSGEGGVSAQAFLGRKADELISKLRDTRDPSQQIGSNATRSHYI